MQHNIEVMLQRNEEQIMIKERNVNKYSLLTTGVRGKVWVIRKEKEVKDDV